MTTTTARQFLNGELVGSRRESSSISPADGSRMGRYADADEEQARHAVASARTAFADTDWSRDRRLRHQVLNGIADAIERRTSELVSLLARENGKVVGEAGFELSLTVPKLRYYAALALSESGRAAEVAPGLHMSSVPEAIGAAGVIVPWNSPVVLAVRSFAPALAAGCTAVVKLPGQTGLVNGLLHEILSEVAGLPAGVLNSLTESGGEVARFLVSSKDIDVLSYTGSTRVGRQIMVDAENARRVDALVSAAAEYATVLVRGGLADPDTAFYHPSLLEVDDPTTPIVQEEVFGPVATFEVFESEADAVRLANVTEYGLAASIWSRDIDRPRRVGRQLRAGTVWTNTWALVADQFEEGGFGQSGLGRLNGLRGLEEFQEYKTYAQIVG